MTKLLYAFCASMLLLCGCTTTFVHPSKTQAEVNRDLQECQFEARKATAGQSNPLIAVDTEHQLVRQCMSLKGYTVK